MLPVCIKLKACHDDASFNLIEKANDIKQYHQSTKQAIIFYTFLGDIMKQRKVKELWWSYDEILEIEHFDDNQNWYHGQK